MPLFWKHYKSEISEFIDDLKAKRPTLEEEQRRGRALLWERSTAPDAQTEYEEGRVRQQPYVYQTQTTQKPND